MSALPTKLRLLLLRLLIFFLVLVGVRLEGTLSDGPFLPEGDDTRWRRERNLLPMKDARLLLLSFIVNCTVSAKVVVNELF